ncbi:MAG: hypothetical protein V3V08_24950 [Nannocystaceae bacterium]
MRIRPIALPPAAWLVLLALVLLADGCRRDNTPRECVVWAETNGHVRGQIYVQDTRASFTAGIARQEVAYIDSYGHIMLLQGSEAIDAAILAGNKLSVLYLKDEIFVSEPITGGHVTIHNGTMRSDFQYNAACSVADAAVGSVALFQLIYPAHGGVGAGRGGAQTSPAAPPPPRTRRLRPAPSAPSPDPQRP